MKFGVLSVTSREYIPDTYVSLYCYSFCYESQCLNFWVLILISVSFKRTFNCVRTHVAFTASLYNFISLLLSCRIGWLLSNWRLTISPWLTVSCLQTTTHHQTKRQQRCLSGILSCLMVFNFDHSCFPFSSACMCHSNYGFTNIRGNHLCFCPKYLENSF